MAGPRILCTANSTRHCSSVCLTLLFVTARIRPTITITIDSGQEESLRRIKDTEGVPVSVQVRKALAMWLESKGVIEKAERKRVATRRRS